jgi:hypothetical protein
MQAVASLVERVYKRSGSFWKQQDWVKDSILNIDITGRILMS